jgi:putative membrane protein
MNLRTYRTFQALIMGGLGIYLFTKVIDGRILFYINQRFVLLVLLGAVGLLLIAQLVLRERPSPEEADQTDHDHAGHDHGDHDHGDHDHGPQSERQAWTLWLLALPLLFGVLIPARSLSTSALQTRGINTTANLSIRGASTSALEIPSTQRSVLDWIRAVSESDDTAALEGQMADVTGFVYHDIRLEKDQFMIGRFSIACCVADAVALGMVANWPEAADLPDNRWVRVRGLVRMMELDGRKLPSIVVQDIEIVPEPSQPYLFP